MLKEILRELYLSGTYSKATIGKPKYIWKYGWRTNISINKNGLSKRRYDLQLVKQV